MRENIRISGKIKFVKTNFRRNKSVYFCNHIKCWAGNFLNLKINEISKNLYKSFVKHLKEYVFSIQY